VGFQHPDAGDRVGIAGRVEERREERRLGLADGASRHTHAVA
jgi:hypothetical protein